MRTGHPKSNLRICVGVWVGSSNQHMFKTIYHVNGLNNDSNQILSCSDSKSKYIMLHIIYLHPDLEFWVVNWVVAFDTVHFVTVLCI